MSSIGKTTGAAHAEGSHFNNTTSTTTTTTTYCHATLKQYSSRCSFLAPFSSNLAFFYPHNLFLVACRSKSVLVVLELLDGSAVLRNAVMSPWIFSSGKVVYHTPGKSARLLSTMIKRAALSSGKVKLAEPPTALRTLVMSRHRLQEDTSAGVIRPLGECSYKHN